MAVSLDGTRLHVASLQGLLEVVSTASLARIGRVPGVGNGFEIAMTRDAAEMYVVQSNNGQTTVLDANTYAVLRVIPGSVPRSIAFNASGSIGMITNAGGSVSFVK